MIVGIGIDIVEVSRFTRDNASDAFLSKVFTPNEISDCEGVKNSAEKYAGKFAIKEALMKAIGAGIRQNLWFRDIEVLNDDAGTPFLNATQMAKQRISELAVIQIHLSISHASGIAVGIVVLEK
jgi:holo-[acyl-carrier protein] synthase